MRALVALSFADELDRFDEPTGEDHAGESLVHATPSQRA